MSEALQPDFELLEDAIKEAGKIALRHHGKGDFETWMKRGVEPVTDIDIEIDSCLKKRLLDAQPDYGWLSEETADSKERLEKETIWIVDPIDGTRAYIHGKDDFSITAALVKNGRPVIGIIFAPARGEFFAAIKGNGARLNNVSISVSEAETLEGMRIQADRDYMNSRKWLVPWPDMIIGKYQSFALRIAAVAAGKYDAALSASPKSEWDVVAGDLILSEAGGVCVDGAGEGFTYNQKNTRLPRIIATTPAIKEDILVQLKKRSS